jgi:hypothetical protein
MTAPIDERQTRLAAPRPTLEACVNDVCPWTGKPVSADALAVYKGRVVGFASPELRDRFFAATLIFDAAILGEAEVLAEKALFGRRRPPRAAEPVAFPSHVLAMTSH